MVRFVNVGLLVLRGRWIGGNDFEPRSRWRKNAHFEFCTAQSERGAAGIGFDLRLGEEIPNDLDRLRRFEFILDQHPLAIQQRDTAAGARGFRFVGGGHVGDGE